MIERTFKKWRQLQKSYLKSKGVELIFALEFYTIFFFRFLLDDYKDWSYIKCQIAWLVSAGFHATVRDILNWIKVIHSYLGLASIILKPPHLPYNDSYDTNREIRVWLAAFKIQLFYALILPLPLLSADFLLVQNPHVTSLTHHIRRNMSFSQSRARPNQPWTEFANFSRAWRWWHAFTACFDWLFVISGGWVLKLKFVYIIIPFCSCLISLAGLSLILSMTSSSWPPIVSALASTCGKPSPPWISYSGRVFILNSLLPVLKM